MTLLKKAFLTLIAAKTIVIISNGRIHKPGESLLSSGFNNFAGFSNWSLILLIILLLRYTVQNLRKYGLLLNAVQFMQLPFVHSRGMYLTFYNVIPFSCCFFIEKCLSLNIISDLLGAILHAINLQLVLLVPILALYTTHRSIGIDATSLFNLYQLSMYLKLWSYIHVNLWYRQARRIASLKKTENDTKQNGEVLQQYPGNLTVSDFTYFLFATTLCYELNFPRNKCIRKRLLFKRTLQFYMAACVTLFFGSQFLAPAIKESIPPFRQMNIAQTLECLLTIAVPAYISWLLLFFTQFHFWLNMLAEGLRFSDRNFYNDWWNAPNFDQFWRSWNYPVHRWALRHLYFPLIDMGYGRTISGNTVFFVSGVFHEVLASATLRSYQVFSLAAMLAQIPISHVFKFLQQYFDWSSTNKLVWVILVFGHTSCAVLYYHFQLLDEAVFNEKMQ